MGTFLLLVVAGCAGPDAPDATTIDLSSHGDGQTILGPRAITMRGTFTGAPVTSVHATANGAEVEGVTHTDASFELPVALRDGANVVTLSAESSAGTTTRTWTLRYPWLDFADGMRASTVIGQPDFVTAAEGTSDRRMSQSAGDPVLADGVLYVPDLANHRILGYRDGVPDTNGAPADFVLGQDDFSSADPGLGPGGLRQPRDVAHGGGRLYVADASHDRVLAWDGLPQETGAPADVVLGQDDFVGGGSGCARSAMYGPSGLAVTDRYLVVADTRNHRVLIFDGHPEANGAEPDLVLGQRTFTTCAANDDGGGAAGSPTARTLDNPSGVWTDGTRLVVADQFNNRVLLWTEFPTQDFEEADVVLGQADMVSNGYATAADRLWWPSKVASNGNQLFVVDRNAHRVLGFDAWPDRNGTPATLVLGQRDFTSSGGMGTTERTFDFPNGIAVAEDALVVTDELNYRVLAFRPLR